MKRARIYGKTINEWRSTDEHGREYLVQQEIEYKEYDENGYLRATGTEDFSLERLHKQTKVRWISTWDGERRNKGGYRWFDGHGNIRFSGDAGIVKAILQKKYDAALIELRA